MHIKLHIFIKRYSLTYNTRISLILSMLFGLTCTYVRTYQKGLSWTTKRSRVASKELTVYIIYTTRICPILEYACPVFHRALPEYLSDDLECIQRRALKIIHSDLSYSEALKVSGLQRLHERRGSKRAVPLLGKMFGGEGGGNLAKRNIGGPGENPPENLWNFRSWNCWKCIHF